MPGVPRFALFPLLAVALAACPGPAGGGSFRASWIGLDTGKVATTAHLSWCPAARRLVLTAVQGDQGVGLAIYPRRALDAGEYPAFDPGADSVRRPGVAAGLRWFTESAVRGYQGDSGGLTLSRDGKQFGGHFGFRLRSLEGADTVRLTGEFSGAPLEPCAPDSTARADSATAIDSTP